MTNNAQPSATETRVMIKSAVNYLVVRWQFSPEKAQEWIWQEARAKKVSLDQVAEAVMNGQEVRYRYSVPF